MLNRKTFVKTFWEPNLLRLSYRTDYLTVDFKLSHATITKVDTSMLSFSDRRWPDALHCTVHITRLAVLDTYRLPNQDINYTKFSGTMPRYNPATTSKRYIQEICSDWEGIKIDIQERYRKITKCKQVCCAKLTSTTRTKASTLSVMAAMYKSQFKKLYA